MSKIVDVGMIWTQDLQAQLSEFGLAILQSIRKEFMDGKMSQGV